MCDVEYTIVDGVKYTFGEIGDDQIEVIEHGDSPRSITVPWTAGETRGDAIRLAKKSWEAIEG